MTYVAEVKVNNVSTKRQMSTIERKTLRTNAEYTMWHRQRYTCKVVQWVRETNKARREIRHYNSTI